jgi:hypothetical protein
VALTFGRDDIVAALDELIDHLAATGTPAHIRVVGGAAVSIAFSRAGVTTDIDAMYGSSAEVDAAVREIAHRHGWPDTWLNDNAKMYASAFVDDDDWVEYRARGTVVVRIAGPELLLAMKLLASRGRRDSADIDVLWAACAVTTIIEAEAIFHRFYPDHDMPERARRQLEALEGRPPRLG